MPKVTVLPHPGICPNGAEFEVPEGANLAKALVANGVNIDHACEFSCACTTCHCYIDKGFDSLEPAEDDEEDLLDQAWGLKSNSRLTCQTKSAKKTLPLKFRNTPVITPERTSNEADLEGSACDCGRAV